MVLDFYKLREQPFGVTPDARYLFLSETHREALASLLYGVSTGRGFMALIARPGMGKTTVLFQGLEQLQETAKTVFLFQTISTPSDFLRALIADLGFNADGNLIDLQSKLNEILLEQSRAGKRLILFIDEAQNLDDSVFELVRMLSNFETARDKLMQIVLSGQPQLADKLASPTLEQLRQRVSIVAQLRPFSPEECNLYIEHRLKVAGYRAPTRLFTRSALDLISKHSGGIPRNINNLCFNAISLGCAMQRSTIDRDILLEVISDLDLGPLRPKEPAAAGGSSGAAKLSPAATWRRIFANRTVRLAAAISVLLILVWLLVRAQIGEKREARAEVNRSVAFAGGKGQDQAKPDQPKPDQPKPDGPKQDQAAADSAVASQPSALDGFDAQVAQLKADPATPQPRLEALERDIEALRGEMDTQRSQEAPVSIKSVRVVHGQTLFSICAGSSGKCDPEVLKEIRRLNPWLKDPDYIESGQIIRVPFRKRLSGAAQPVVEQVLSASPTEADKQ